MKKFLGILVLGLLISNFASAETWDCTYQFEGETRKSVVKRIDRLHFTNIYEDNTYGGKMKIVKETEKFIHIYDNIEPYEDAYLLVLDKGKSSFVMVALKYEESSNIVEGKCTIK